jgi:hypothetical protein
MKKIRILLVSGIALFLCSNALAQTEKDQEKSPDKKTINQPPEKEPGKELKDSVKLKKTQNDTMMPVKHEPDTTENTIPDPVAPPPPPTPPVPQPKSTKL